MVSFRVSFELRAASLSTLWRYITRTCQTKLMRSIPFWADKRPLSNLYKTFYVYSGTRAVALNATQLRSINTDTSKAKSTKFSDFMLAVYFHIKEMLRYKHQVKHINSVNGKAMRNGTLEFNFDFRVEKSSSCGR